MFVPLITTVTAQESIFSQAWWSTPAIPALGKLRQEECQEFKTNFVEILFQNSKDEEGENHFNIYPHRPKDILSAEQR